MPSLKEIRNRITSVASTMQITSAMKMVSAAKLKKAQDAIQMLRPYSMKMQEILQNISSSLDNDSGGEFTQTKERNKILFIVITSNRGLAGAFNTNINKEVKHQIRNNFSDKEVEIITIGKKAFDILKKEYQIYRNDSAIWDNVSSEVSSKLADEMMDLFLQNKYSQVFLVYNHFKNAATQEVKFEQLLPISLPKSDENQGKNVDYIYEPNKIEIVKDLIPKTIRTQLYKAILDSRASEHGARMTAMHKATDNAENLRRELILSYNKARQASITKEILEIVGGAEALKG